MLKFETIAQLNEWLIAKGIDTTVWGVGGAKSVENLWSELTQGESQIQAEPPLRLVQIVNVLIRSGKRFLVEAGQKFGENQYRYRHMPPTEKLKPGETPTEAAIRCLQEELEVAPQRVKILSCTTEPERTLQESPSYPGLTTVYIRYEVEAKVEGLPRTSFSTLEAAHDDGDPVKSHQWLWQPANQTSR